MLRTPPAGRSAVEKEVAAKAAAARVAGKAAAATAAAQEVARAAEATEVVERWAEVVARAAAAAA